MLRRRPKHRHGAGNCSAQSRPGTARRRINASSVPSPYRHLPPAKFGPRAHTVPAYEDIERSVPAHSYCQRHTIFVYFCPVKKFPLLILFVTWVFSYASAQEDQLRLISSSHSRLNASTGNMVNYRPVYEHQGSTLSADSGYIYSDDLGRQYFDAFGKVIITQPNGTVIYADKLHYAAETRLATLTNNVRMVDDDAVLTTNHLTYNMKSSVGTYTGGGRIVNTTDTITSHNAYYFDHTKDAYFRHDVIVRTPNVKIYTDTMRYNSGTKMTYFYGPTNIRGQDDENLYTERGQYNTETEQAWFDSHNLYTQGSRFLRGDSLYYDGKSGNGRAVNNVVFIDTADQFFAY